MNIEIEVEPELLSVNLLYHVCQYLCGDVPLWNFRDWEFGMFLERKSGPVADACFYQYFEGRYAEYGLLTDRPKPDYFSRDEWLKLELHKLIGAQMPNLEPTGTFSQLVEVRASDLPKGEAR